MKLRQKNRKTGFNVYLSNDMETLVDICRLVMRQYPLENVFDEEVILISNLGMKTYLLQNFAQQDGVVSLCQFPMIWDYIFALQHELFPISKKVRHFVREHMMWNIFSLLQQYVQHKEVEYISDIDLGEQIRYYLYKDEFGDRAFEFAAKIADVFDIYQMFRPEWIRQWNRIPLSALREYDKNPDDPTNPLRQFIEGLCKEFSRSRSSFDQEQTVTASQVALLRSFLESNVWQIKLWCLLKFNYNMRDDKQEPLSGEDLKWQLHNLDRAEAMENLIQYLDANKNLPLSQQRIIIFGSGNLSNLALRFFKSLSKHLAVHIFLLDPCAEYWGDISNGYHLNFKGYIKRIQGSIKTNADLKRALGRRLLEVKFDDLKEDEFDRVSGERIEGHPLLLSYGKQDRDLYTLFYELYPEEDPPFVPAFINIQDDFNCKKVTINAIAYDEYSGGSLLHFLQNQLLRLHHIHERYRLDKNDASLSIHVCHTKKREVELLREELLRLFNEAYVNGRQLLPNEIVVMVPAIDSYAPYIDAVFGSNYKEDDPDYIPYIITDRSEIAVNTVAQAVLLLLQLSTKRITASTVIDLLNEVHIAKHFGLTIDDVETIAVWMNKNSIYWGLDKKDSEEVAEITLPGTFEAGLERMIAGTLLGENDEIPCFTDIEGSDAIILGKFWDFIQALRHLKKFFTPHLALAPDDWSQALNTRLFARFFDTQDFEEQMALKPVYDIVDHMKNVVSDIRVYPAITLPVFTAAIAEKLMNTKAYTPFFKERVNFCSLIPMRGVPFKHIFLLGINDIDFPRNTHMPSFQLLSHKYLYKRGDRSHNLSDRSLFLHTLLSARESLYISYIGQSPVDKQELNPSIVLKELIYYVSDMCSLDGVDESSRIEAVKKRLIRYEHLNAWHLDNYKGQEDPLTPHRVPSYNNVCINYEVELHKEKPMLGLGSFGRSNAVLQHSMLDLKVLTVFMKNPIEFFARDILNLRLQLHDNSALQEDENFVLDMRDKALLLQKILAFPKEEWSAFLEREASLGVLPYGIFKEQVATTLLETAAKVSKALQQRVSTLAEITYELCPKREFHFSLPKKALEQRLAIPPLLLLDENLHKEEERVEFTISLRAERCPQAIVFSSFSKLQKTRSTSTKKGQEATALKNAKLLWAAAYQAIAWYLYDGSLQEILIVDREGSTAKFTAFSSVETVARILQQILVFYIQGCCAPYPMSPTMLSKLELRDGENGGELLQLQSSEDSTFGNYEIEAQTLFNNIEQLLDNETLYQQAKNYFVFFIENIAPQLKIEDKE